MEGVKHSKYLILPFVLEAVTVFSFEDPADQSDDLCLESLHGSPLPPLLVLPVGRTEALYVVYVLFL